MWVCGCLRKTNIQRAQTSLVAFQVVIKYVPYVGDSKRAMDEYTSEIMMGGLNTIALHNTCEVSIFPFLSNKTYWKTRVELSSCRGRSIRSDCFCANPSWANAKRHMQVAHISSYSTSPLQEDTQFVFVLARFVFATDWVILNQEICRKRIHSNSFTLNNRVLKELRATWTGLGNSLTLKPKKFNQRILFLSMFLFLIDHDLDDWESSPGKTNKLSVVFSVTSSLLQGSPRWADSHERFGKFFSARCPTGVEQLPNLSRFSPWCPPEVRRCSWKKNSSCLLIVLFLWLFSRSKISAPWSIKISTIFIISTGFMYLVTFEWMIYVYLFEQKMLLKLVFLI